MPATEDEIAAYPIDTRVSMDLHPQQILGMAEYDSDTAVNFTDTIAAFDEARKAVSKVYDAKQAVAGDPTMNDAAKLLKVDDLAGKLLASVLPRMVKAENYHKEAVRLIEQSFSEPLNQRAAQTISVEVRNYVRSMPAAPADKNGFSRLGFLMNAINEHDHDTMSAVLGGPHYLSGITRENQQMLKRRWHEVASAPSFKKLKAHEAGLALLQRKGGLVQLVLGKAVGTIHDGKREWTAAQLRALRNQSAKAFGQVGA